MPKEKKSDRVEIEKRITAVQQWLLQGYTTRAIVQNVSKKWGVDERQAYNYMKRAWSDFAERYKGAKKNEWFAFHIEARLNLLSRALEKEHYGVCRSILEDIAKLQGFYVQKHAFTDPSGEKDYGVPISDSELRKRLVAILSSNGNGSGEFDLDKVLKKIKGGEEDKKD
ncbi:MAG: hypothetical protein GXO75_16135 [Calditrichaeota bacterium]|nr:hypothetical protein [Calditrichota bacterium]